MIKIAITGNIASGKSVVEGILREKKIPILDCDEVVHELYKEDSIKKQIITIFFGFDILEDGNISRPKLGKIVFKDAYLRKQLENIIYPYVKKEIWRFFSQNESEKIAFVSVPLLFESGFETIFDKVVLIYADDKIRIDRLIKRNNLEPENAQNRLDIQMQQDEKVKLADYVIYNNSSIEDLSKEVEKLLDYCDKNSTAPESK